MLSRIEPTNRKTSCCTIPIFFLNCTQLEEKIAEHLPYASTLTLDLRSVSIIDSSSCEYLLELTRENSNVIIVGAQGAVSNMLKAAGVECGGTLEDDCDTVIA